MNIGMVGLGKLGLPVSIAIASRGHSVFGYDISPVAEKNVSAKIFPHEEDGYNGNSIQSMFEASDVRFSTIPRIVDMCRIIFISVQTPHEEKFDGTYQMTDDRKDFIYDYLVDAVKKVAAEIKLQRKHTSLCIISTVLPGTVDSEIIPLLNEYVRIAYTPQFIAMGTVLKDYLEPEFHLFGHSLMPDEARGVKEFFKSINSEAPILEMTVREAELVKVSYNTLIGMKIIFANTLMEMSHKLGGVNVDVVTNALKNSFRRLISTAYLSGGMGDAGGCHPRDQLAMSALARKLNLSSDIFSDIMKTREEQAKWLCSLMNSYDLPKAIIGYTYKQNTRLTDGSAAILCKRIMESSGQKVFMYDAKLDSSTDIFDEPHVYLIGQINIDQKYYFPKGSVVIDPFRYLNLSEDGVLYIPVGGV